MPKLSRPYWLHSSLLLTYPPLHFIGVPARIMSCQCFLYLPDLSRHLVSCHIVFHQVSPSQLWPASISNSIYRHLQYLSRGIIFISPNHLNLFFLMNSAIGYMCASFQMSTFLT